MSVSNIGFWYIIRVSSSREEMSMEQIKTLLSSTKDPQDIEAGDMIEEMSIPKKTIFGYKNGIKVEKSVPAYSGYLFIKLKKEINQEFMIFLRKVLRNSSILTTGDIITPISNDEYQNMISTLDQISHTAQNNLSFVEGVSVKIKSGAFSSLVGLVKDVDNRNKNLLINVQIFGRETEVNLPFEEVELLGNDSN